MVSESKILPQLLQHQAGLGKQNNFLCVYFTPAKCSRAAPSCIMKKFFTLIKGIFYSDHTDIGNLLIYSLNSGGFGMGSHSSAISHLCSRVCRGVLTYLGLCVTSALVPTCYPNPSCYKGLNQYTRKLEGGEGTQSLLLAVLWMWSASRGCRGR